MSSFYSFVQKHLFGYELREKIQYRIDMLRSKWLRSAFQSCHESVVIGRLGLLKGARHISIGELSNIQQGIYLTAWERVGQKSCTPEIVIGRDCHIGAFNHITSINKIIIGDGFVSGKWVTITDNSHGNIDMESLQVPVSKREVISKGPVIIGKNVWVGDKVTILPNVSIGDGVVIGANSVVTKNIPSYCVVGGNPAKVIKQFKK